MTTEKGTPDSYTEDCSSGTSASKIPTDVSNVKLYYVSDIKTEPHIDYDKKLSSQKNIDSIEPSEPVETTHSTPKVRRSSRYTRGIPPTRYRLVVSNRVNVSTKFGKWLKSISNKSDDIYDHVFD